MDFEVLERAWAAAPDQDEALIALVGALVLARRGERAVEVAEEADEGAGGASARRAVVLGTAYEEVGRLLDAEEAFARALRIDRDQAAAAAGLARVRLSRGDGAGAVAAARLANNLDDDSPEGRRLLVEVLVSLGRIDEAEAVGVSRKQWSVRARTLAEDFERVNDVERAGAPPGEVLDAAEAALRTGQSARAAALAERAADASAEAQIAWRAGRICMWAGQAERAEELLKRAITTEPTHAEALDNLGTISLQLGKGPHAVKFASLAVAVAPDEASYHFNLGNARAACGELTEAARCYETALGLDPGLADAAHNLEQVRAVINPASSE